MVWNLRNLLFILYNPVEEIVDLAAAANVPNKQYEIFTIGVEMIRKTQDFDKGLSECFEHPEAEHMWHI